LNAAIPNAAIQAVEFHLPERVLSNQELAEVFPDLPAEKIRNKTGISERHIAAEGECASDLAYAAAQKLLATGVCSAGDIDFLLLCTQSPDYFLPTTACTLQARLGLPTTSGAMDFNLGCSGFIYGLGLAQGLIQSGQAKRVLLITAETYSKYVHPRDRSVRTLFGDGAAATLLGAEPAEGPGALQPVFVYGTDGRGVANIVVPAGGFREPTSSSSAEAVCDENGNYRSRLNLFMNGPEVFNFTLQAVPDCVGRLLARASLTLDDIQLFVFHQANQYMLEHLRKKMKIPQEKFCLSMAESGNTVSSTIPIALRHALTEGRLHRGDRVMLVGFGVGYSWGACLLEWPYLGLARSGE
jgi:3-oxoacyl-[acyl-carrier-protein] synthase-3